MNLLSSDDLSKDSINKIFEIADKLTRGNEEASLKEHAILLLYFEKPSTRTSVSFEVAVSQFGGDFVYITPEITQRSRGETIGDTFKVLSSYCDFIAARLYKHEDLLEIAKASSVPVINALTDLEHPTQALADVYTIRQKKKNIRNLRIAFVGDIASNTCNSLMLTAGKLGAEIVLVSPKACIPNSKYVAKAREYTKVVITDNPKDGLEDADVIYTDTFVSMGQEAEAARRRKLFEDYQVNQKLVAMAKEDAIVMHCLPAHRGEEITSDVLDGPQSVAWEQAKNKLLVDKAILVYLSQK